MTFPALVPSVRTFTSGDVPQSIQVSLSGVNTGFRRGNRRMEQTLSLGYTNLTETQLNLIKDHYIDRQGTFDIFFLSAEVWNGYTTPPIGLVDTYAWRYAGPPTISDGIVGRWAVDVELVSHAIDISELVIDGLSASAADSREYNVDSGSASATPARNYVITAGLAA
jgi:hypothetical protein|tara:strand:- start:732 stop:1232 length:501 start_codon:yes stop_codon:yes gene_type:complete